MTLDRARWDKGITYDAFKAAMTRNQERFAENESRVMRFARGFPKSKFSRFRRRRSRLRTPFKVICSTPSS